jgi:hypothetical protein
MGSKSGSKNRSASFAEKPYLMNLGEWLNEDCVKLHQEIPYLINHIAY